MFVFSVSVLSVKLRCIELTLVFPFVCLFFMVNATMSLLSFLSHFCRELVYNLFYHTVFFLLAMTNVPSLIKEGCHLN